MKLIEQFVKKLFDDIAPIKEVWPQSFGTGWLGAKRFHDGLPANYWRPQRNVIRCTSQRVTKRHSCGCGSVSAGVTDSVDSSAVGKL